MTAPVDRGLVFDLDGTLVDSYEAIARSLNHARREAGLSAIGTDTVRGHVGRGLESLVEDLVPGAAVELSVRRFRERYAQVYAEDTRALPDVPDTVEALGRRGIPMAVASNKPARFGEPILEALGMRRWFRSVHGPDTVGATKPHPAMLRRAITDLGVDAADVLYVGDMPLDVETADRAGVRVALVATGSCDVSTLLATGRPVWHSIREIMTRVAGTGAREG